MGTDTAHEKSYKIATLLIHGEKIHTPDLVDSIIEPVYLSAVYRYFPGIDKERPHVIEYKYGREDNPTVVYLEKKIARIESGVDALAFSSGIAAINTVLHTLVIPGSTLIVAPLDLYGSTVTILKDTAQRQNVKLILTETGTDTLVNTILNLKVEDLRDVRHIVIFFETVSNPVLRVYDITQICEVARELTHKVQDSLTVYVIVDNTIPTPVGVRPLTLGADVVIYSTSKYLGGHNDLIGGIAVFRNDEVCRKTWDTRRLMGTIMEPLTAFLVDRGLKTLHVRMRRHEENARAVAEFLLEHPKVVDVIYPGLSTHPDYRIAVRQLACMSGIVSFRVKGTLEDTLRLCKSTRLIVPGVSFGGTESIITHPYTTTHKYLTEEEKRVIGVTENLVRLSVGLEDPEDIIEDLDRALQCIP